jgi:acetyltransferase
MSNKLENFFNPKTIAVIGASSDKNKVGYAIMANLLRDAKRDIYPVSISEKEILGLKTYSSIKEIGGNIDLALIAVRADIVPAILEECAVKKVQNVIIIASGFKEEGLAGAELEKKVADIAKRNGIALLGPNCLGIIDAHTDLNASFAASKPKSGHIAFLSQSGALGTAILDKALSEGVGFSKFISLGNEAALSEIEFLEYLKDDKDTKAILMYVEQLSDGQKFMKLATEITKKKPIALIKSGRSTRGQQAVMSHTGSLAPEDAVFTAACKQAGIIVVESIREFFNMAKLFEIGIIKPRQNLIILTNAGGPAVVTADLIDLSRSLSLVELGNETKEQLKKVLPPMAAVNNPVDIIGDALSDRYESALKILIEEKSADAIIVLLTPQMMTQAEDTAKLLGEYNKKKLIIPVFIGGPTIENGLIELKKVGLVNFTFPKDAVEALDNLARGAKKVESEGEVLAQNTSSAATQDERRLFRHEQSDMRKSAPVVVGGADKELDSNKLQDSRLRGNDKNSQGDKSQIPTINSDSKFSLNMMPFNEMCNLFKNYEIDFQGILVKEKNGLAEAMKKVGAGPFIMKAISPDVIYKTDMGAVKLNLKNVKEAEVAWDEIVSSVKSKNPQAVIDGMLVQSMVNGKEVIIGMKRDATFGPTILFGLGGIFTEALKDTSLRIAPVSKEVALEMIREIRGSNILTGLRGEASVNLEKIADIIVKLSKLAIDHPEIKEIDLNPVIVNSDETFVVDARVMI